MYLNSWSLALLQKIHTRYQLRYAYLFIEVNIYMTELNKHILSVLTGFELSISAQLFKLNSPFLLLLLPPFSSCYVFLLPCSVMISSWRFFYLFLFFEFIYSPLFFWFEISLLKWVRLECFENPVWFLDCIFEWFMLQYSSEIWRFNIIKASYVSWYFSQLFSGSVLFFIFVPFSVWPIKIELFKDLNSPLN